MLCSRLSTSVQWVVSRQAPSMFPVLFQGSKKFLPASCCSSGFRSYFPEETGCIGSSKKIHRLEKQSSISGERRDMAVRSLSTLKVSAIAATTVGLTKAAEAITPEVTFTAPEDGLLSAKGDVLAVLVFDSAIELDDAGKFKDAELAALDDALGGVLAELASEEDFKAKPGQSSFLRLSGKGFKKVGLVGLGKVEGAQKLAPWKAAGGAVAGLVKGSQAEKVSFALIGAQSLPGGAPQLVASGIATGLVLGLFEDTRFKKEGKKVHLKLAELYGLAGAGDLTKTFSDAVSVAAGVIYARQLVNSPPNVLTPASMAESAMEIVGAHGDVLTGTVLEQSECEALGMGAYLGVSAASTNPPKFIHLKYTPPTGEVSRRLAIVGKGLTFDSGGYNLKTGPGSMIELMKFDMGGAAATLGAAKAIAAVQPPGVEVNFIVAACENMISGGGMRPGDILTASNGKTIEVNNTDAEGRLTLADALQYACKLQVDKIVDLATLTGACIIALGNEIGGLFTPSSEMAAELTASAEAAGEKLWRMPMEESYGEMLKSNVADMVNTGGRAGGSITAALFLKEFVDENIPWAHLDIAGPVWADKKGATGFAVSTLVNWVKSHSPEQ
eukprot:TRINITY_DN1220_c0_g1_i1.p1 TRINITY_DN1220_c0_g1~~TRINITY_DN1220_c0_g1_i1.p1  ORF type:complete len:613 (+),score=143.32 TRINITY_DN1220_c0_g1_i1:155-1993(+)